MIEEDQQHKRENKHADDLSGNANVVDNRHQSYAPNINDRTDYNRKQGDKDGVVQSHDSWRYTRENSKQRNGYGKRHSCDRENSCEKVEPTCEPAKGKARQALTPLVN